MPRCTERAWPSALAALLLASAAAPAAAAPLDLPDLASVAAEHDIPIPFASRGERPAAIPAGGPVVDPADLAQPEALARSLRGVLALEPAARRLTVAGGTARAGDYAVGSDARVAGHLVVLGGNADLYGTVSGNVVTYRGDVVVHEGATVEGSVLAIGGVVRLEGGTVRGSVRTLRDDGAAPTPAAPVAAPARAARNLAGVIGVVLALGTLGAGLVAFARPQLEIVSDTVVNSFGRAFVTGLLAQILLAPTFGMLVVGLVLSVAGILLLPFAVVAFVLLAIAGIVGGTLAVAHAMGETYTRRRLARGVLGSPNSYRYLAVGTAALGVLWVLWAAFSWVPLAGDIIRGTAVLTLWFAATTGFGAALLSRGGVREEFAGRLLPPEAMTDEYLWATPQFGVPAVKRPVPRGEPGGR